MLDLSSIQNQYPQLSNLPGKEQFFIREYLQYKILELIYAITPTPQLVFLGGTAIRIIHHNTRFSEDLDFDNQGVSESEFTAMMLTLQKQLSLLGYRVETQVVAKEALRCYIKFVGILNQYNLSSNDKEKLIIQIDTTPQHFEYEPNLVLLNKFDVFSKIPVVPVDILLSQKIFAAFDRPRAKGRDFFDIVYLWSITHPNYQYLQQKMGLATPEALKTYLIEQSKKLDFYHLATDVAPFLFDPAQNKRVLLFPEFVSQLKI